MKKQSEFNFTQISKEHSKELTTLVKETLVPVKTLTTAELWNIQRRSKPMMYRRHLV